ncbi:MAG: DUF975 family protein [Candidatus Cloacimonadaceae bacterium]
MNYSEIRQSARALLQNLWTPLIPIWFVYFLISFGVQSIFGEKGAFLAFVTTLIIGGPLLMGITRIFLRIYNKESFELGNLFDGFKEFNRTLSAYLLIVLYVFLWSLLLIIPGIIAALGYSMTFYIMAENPDITATEAMQQSKRMMFGHKTELFMLGLSFIGWVILAAIPFGIGFLWLSSYWYTAYTIFYHRIKAQPEAVIS